MAGGQALGQMLRAVQICDDRERGRCALNTQFFLKHLPAKAVDKHQGAPRLPTPSALVPPLTEAGEAHGGEEATSLYLLPLRRPCRGKVSEASQLGWAPVVSGLPPDGDWNLSQGYRWGLSPPATRDLGAGRGGAHL